MMSVSRSCPSYELLLVIVLATTYQVVRSTPFQRERKIAIFELKNRFVEPSQLSSRNILHSQIYLLRGGATEDDEEEKDSDDESAEEDEVEAKEEEKVAEAKEEERETDYEELEEEGEVAQYDEYDESDDEDTSAQAIEKPFVDPYFVPPSFQLYTTFGAMMLSRKIDMFSPVVVRLVRIAFIVQIIVQQIFIFYVRIMAKKNNDRTPVTQNNLLSGMLQSQLGQQGGGNDMVKNLASSFLSSETTVRDYDIKQASGMQGGIVMSMAFMWFMHFKLEKVQPLLIQVVTGFLQLFYHPLFQVYILGRNLERPFKTQGSAVQKMMEAQQPETSSAADVETDKEDPENDEDKNSAEAGDENEDEDESDEDEEESDEEAESEDEGGVENKEDEDEEDDGEKEEAKTE